MLRYQHLPDLLVLSLSFRLSVLNQILHKLRVTKVDGTCVVLIQLGNLRHIFVCQSEVKDVEVLCHTFLVARLGDGYDAALSEPSEGYLGSTLTILRTDGCEFIALYDALYTLSTKWSPCHHLRFKLGMYRFDARLLDESVALQLVHHRLYIYIMSEIEETTRLEVGYAYGTYLTGTIGFLHCPPRTEHVSVCLMDQQ